MKNILIGIDFHDDSWTLINKAIEISKPTNAKIWLLHASAPHPDFVGFEVGPQYVRDFRADELKVEHQALKEMVDELKSMGLEADGLLIQGTTTDVVLKEATKLEIDLVVVGRHDHGFMYSLFFGNHATEIVKESDVPVLVIPLKEQT